MAENAKLAAERAEAMNLSAKINGIKARIDEAVAKGLTVDELRELYDDGMASIAESINFALPILMDVFAEQERRLAQTEAMLRNATGFLLYELGGEGENIEWVAGVIAGADSRSPLEDALLTKADAIIAAARAELDRREAEGGKK